MVMFFCFLLQAKYRAKGIEAFKDYSVVTDTPVYVTAIQNSQNLSDVSVLCTMLTHNYLYFIT